MKDMAGWLTLALFVWVCWYIICRWVPPSMRRPKLRVFRIDDGESHHYVAPDEESARMLHRSGDWLGPPEEPEEDWDVSEVPEETKLVVHFDDESDLKNAPAGAAIDGLRVAAPAAAWAGTYTEAGFLCSSVF